MKLLLACYVVAVSVCSAYPTTFPFENEKVKAASVYASTPTYTFDADDDGGYLYSHFFAKIFTEDDLPVCFSVSGAIMYMFVNQYKVSPAQDPGNWNCTDNGDTVVPSMYLGTVGDHTFCQPEDCCKEYVGKRCAGKAVPQAVNYAKWKSTFEAGMCTEWFSEAVYCNQFSNGIQNNCIDTWVDVDTRIISFPCYDSIFFFLMSCPLYKMAGYWIANEPPKFFTSSSLEESTAHFSVFKSAADRVCKPYSYYYPENFVDNTSEDSSVVKDSKEEGSGAHILTTFSIMSFLSYVL